VHESITVIAGVNDPRRGRIRNVDQTVRITDPW